MIFRSERPTPFLVPRYVEGASGGAWHICMSDYRLSHAAIVTLEALCGVWCFGTLSRYSHTVMRHLHPDARFCQSCEAIFQDRRAELDPQHHFRWRAPGSPRGDSP